MDRIGDVYRNGSAFKSSLSWEGLGAGGEWDDRG